MNAVNTNVNEFAQDIMQMAQNLAEANDSDTNTELLRYYLDCMEECGEVSAPEICIFSEGRAKLSAYDYNDEAESLDLFLFIHATTLASRVDTRVQTGINSLKEFYNQCLKLKSPFRGGEKEFACEVQDAINIVRESKGKVNVIRFYILTDGFVSSPPEINTFNNDGDETIYECNIWDIARIFRQDQMKKGNDKIVIDFENDKGYYVPNKKTKNNELTVPKVQCLKVDDENPYVDTYLAIISGEVLAKIYNQYRTMLLEKNVRAFLRNKSKVNKRIMATLKKEPEMFFSFNNGISTTASSVELKQMGRTLYITKLTDWQIVNGGQTTASIASTQGCDLSKVFVQMKVSVVKNKENYSEIVKEISTCANSQTGIKQSDFESGDKYLIDMEGISKKEVSPITNKKWFFERMRGIYADTLASLGKYDKESFKEEFPKDQMLTKIDVARLMVIWDMKPHVACNSREKCFASYMRTLKEGTNVDALYWHHVVALSILYKTIDKCVEKRCGQKGFKSRTTAYTMAAISYLTEKKLNLAYIWKNQKVQSQLEEIIEREVVIVNDFLERDNSRSFTKNAKCWDELKEWIDGTPLPISLTTAEEDEDDYNEEEENIISQANAISQEWWQALYDWTKAENRLSLIERRNISGYIKRKDNGRLIKKINQAKNALALKNKAELLGFTFEASL
jgi:hypothetical protein